MVIREPPLEDYRPRICMKRTARVGTVYMRSWHSQDAALGSEEDFSSSDQSGEDSEEERLYFEKRIDPKEDFCNRATRELRIPPGALGPTPCPGLIFLASSPSQRKAYGLTHGLKWLTL
ncbi:hypothetical protein MHYP_G00018880 [Metynnis hypsauchen]